MNLQGVVRAAALFAATLAPALGASSELLRLLPPDATTVAGIDVDRSASSRFGQYVISKMRADDKGLQALITSTGFDPRKDLREILVAGRQFGGLEGAQKQKGLMLARGSFDTERIHGVMLKSGAEATEYKGIRLIRKKNEDGVLGFLDASTAIAGSPEIVRAAIDRRETGGGVDPRIAAKVTEVSARYDAWMVSTAPTLPPGTPAGKGPINPQMLQAIEMTSGGIQLGENVVVEGEAVTRSEKDATALLDVLKFFTGMAQLNRDRPGAEQFVKLLESLQVKAVGPAVKVMFSIPEIELERMIESAGKTKKIASR